MTREGTSWIAEVVNLSGAHTYAGNLAALDAAVREVIALVADLPDDAPFDVEYSFEGVDDRFVDAAQLGARRAQAEIERATLADSAAHTAAALAAAGYSQRDIAWLLRMTVGRVSQILSEHAA
ncbi:hypothetical protein LH407_03080 [Antiquaquibacter oligotrophicus]|uniref:hypothetical protein n=1 Tax=Antiquaquibacter oligotrophicus TaxID=2880260 RepID=UPI002AC8C5CC|nr:hypothetical protein [Antiquaquibacter oligotrophicus]UDF13855.1 hypothetical protein LH407_03080 [Antiquaquibacter oligotrophicus]